MFKSILCPIDGSNPSLQALHVAARLAAEQGASLTICEVVDAGKASAIAFGEAAMSAALLDELEAEARSSLDVACASVREVISARVATIVSDPVNGILDTCATNACDLIVMGSHGRSGIPRALIGSIAEGVVRHACVPVMVIRRTKAATVVSATVVSTRDAEKAATAG